MPGKKRVGLANNLEMTRLNGKPMGSVGRRPYPFPIQAGICLGGCREGFGFI